MFEKDNEFTELLWRMIRDSVGICPLVLQILLRFWYGRRYGCRGMSAVIPMPESKIEETKKKSRNVTLKIIVSIFQVTNSCVWSVQWEPSSPPCLDPFWRDTYLYLTYEYTSQVALRTSHKTRTSRRYTSRQCAQNEFEKERYQRVVAHFLE